MTDWQCTRELDRPLVEGIEAKPLDLSQFPGTWINTNEASPEIVRIDLNAEEGDLLIRVYAPDDWGEVKAEILYAASLTSRVGMSFMARYELPDRDAHMEGNLNLGLLVVASFNTLKDGSGRSNYFGREFFYRLERERSA